MEEIIEGMGHEWLLEDITCTLPPNEAFILGKDRL